MKVIPLLSLISSAVAVPTVGHAQFMDSFEDPEISGWEFYTGDGSATVDFVHMDGFARILVDATGDSHNVWWAIIKRDVAAALDLEKLQDPAYELRVEARVRVSHAPRRLNFMINTQRTTDFHQHLMEYDIPDTSGWHTISMTTRDFDALPGDNVNVQLGVTDWGPEKYQVDVDYYRADVVRIDSAAPDVGEPLIYHPPVRDPATFAHHLDVAHDSLINSDFPDVNFNDWSIRNQDGAAQVLTISANQWAVLRWDFTGFADATADGAGLLELTTHSVAKGGDYIGQFGEDLGIEFGKIRVIEILGGDPAWDQKTVTFNSILQGGSPTEVFNSQMIFDVELADTPGAKTYVTLSRPVMQRLLDGKTKGILLGPLGSVVASVHAREDSNETAAPKLLFNTAQ